jgi:hypothetical protein
MVVLYIEGAQSRGGAVSPPPKKNPTHKIIKTIDLIKNSSTRQVNPL